MTSNDHHRSAEKNVVFKVVGSNPPKFYGIMDSKNISKNELSRTNDEDRMILNWTVFLDENGPTKPPRSEDV